MPLVYASPPRPIGDIAVVGQVLSNISFGINVNDGSINTAFPSMVLVASQSFDFQVALVSVSLCSSIVNATTDGVVGAFVARNTVATLNVNGATDMYVEHLVNQGLGHSYRSGTVFDDSVAPVYAAGQSVGLYMCSAGTGFANNRMVATVTLRYMSLE